MEVEFYPGYAVTKQGHAYLYRYIIWVDKVSVSHSGRLHPFSEKWPSYYFIVALIVVLSTVSHIVQEYSYIYSDKIKNYFKIKNNNQSEKLHKI